MRRSRLLFGLLCAGSAGLSIAGGCNTATVNNTLRSLEESGKVAFVCMGSPRDAEPRRTLEQCRNVTAAYRYDYSGGIAGSGGTYPTTTTTTTTTNTAGAGGAGGSTGTAGSGGSPSIPHLYGLVTQTYRGEVAVVDLTTQGGDWLIDQNPAIPGPNFLPVGGQPTGIVTTPGGTAAFVTVAEVGREGIFAIPTSRILRPEPDLTTPPQTPPRLSSWPACSLPAAPGEPLLVDDPADPGGRERATCNDPYETPDDSSPNGALTTEAHGRQKLVVPLPALGGVAIIDAQTLLDRPDGSFDPCPVERWVLLDDQVPSVSPPQPEPPPGSACKNPKIEPSASLNARPLPGGAAFAAGKLYLSDLQLPLIHRLNLESPCDPKLLPPLLPFSAEDPTRVVTTSRLAITPQPTADLRRYLYANDVGEGTVMVFDVSDDADEKGAPKLTPLQRSHPEWTPLQPRDRLRFVSAPRDIVVAQRDVALPTQSSGVAPEGTFCDPNPRHCLNHAPNAKPPQYWDGVTCSYGTPGQQYETSLDYSSGAGPYKLRGTFAFVLLTNGQVEIIDIEDLDGPCRGPLETDALFGCSVPTCTKQNPECPAGYACPEEFVGDEAHACVAKRCHYSPGTDECPPGFGCAIPSDAQKNYQAGLGDPGTTYACVQITSGEQSCNVVQRNTLRSGVYEATGDKVGNHSPGIVTEPQLFDKTGAFLDLTDVTNGKRYPVLRATIPPGADDGNLPKEATNAPTLMVGGTLQLIDPKTGLPGARDTNTDQILPGTGHILALNLETPRAQSVDQGWTVTFEGALPHVGTVPALLQVTLDMPPADRPNGVYDDNARYCDAGVQSFEAVKEQLAAAGTPSDAKARSLADLVQLADDLPDQDNLYWTVTAAQPPNACTYDLCRQIFGNFDAPTANRDFLVTEAYQDRLLLEDHAATEKVASCTNLEDCTCDAKDTSPTPCTHVLSASALASAKCCLPTFLTYYVRPGNQWVVAGEASGFLHHVIPDPVTGACRTSCDPVRGARMNGRVLPTPAGTKVVRDGDPTAFINQFFRFAVFNGVDDKNNDVPPTRDMQLRFRTSGSFAPLTITLIKDSKDVAPVAITYVPPTGELAVTDGLLQGLLTVNLSSVDSSRQFY
jgi:hypothetical protein